MSSLWDAVKTFHCKGACPHTSCVLSVIRGIRAGALYGAKIRAPHAFVMTFLFYPGTFQEKIKQIALATYTHSRNLALFVGLYKALCCVMRHIRGKESGLTPLLAGFIGGWLMFGTDSAVNSQINMYILSRVTLGSARALVRHGFLRDFQGAYPLYAGVCWALVMYLFQYQEGTLQKSLISSMTYLYADSNSWPTDATGVVDWLSR